MVVFVVVMVGVVVVVVVVVVASSIVVAVAVVSSSVVPLTITSTVAGIATARGGRNNVLQARNACAVFLVQTDERAAFFFCGLPRGRLSCFRASLLSCFRFCLCFFLL